MVIFLNKKKPFEDDEEGASLFIFILFILTRTYLILVEPSVVVEKSVPPSEAPIKG